MSFDLVTERKARKSLARLPENVYVRVNDAIERLLEDPYPPASAKLQGTENRRLRVGDYRVVYFVSEEEAGSGTVYVLDVGHRQGIYG